MDKGIGLSPKTSFTPLEVVSLVLIFFYVAANLLTLNLSPLPWFDEVFFADISRAVSQTGKMNLTIFPGIFKEEITTYGPVYFWIQGLLIKIWGLNPFTFRLLNFASGVACMALLFKIVRLQSPKFAIPAAAILVFDPIFVQNLHSGRMDLLVVSMSLGALYTVLSGGPKISKPRLLVCGVLLSLAYLTSPRAIFLVIPVLVVTLTRYGIYPSLMVGALVASLISIYIFRAFGGYLEYYQAFTQNKAVVAHIGTNAKNNTFFRYWHHYPVYLGVILSVVAYISNPQKKYFSAILVSGLTILLFHFLVVEKGPYSAMIFPYYILIILTGYLSGKNIWISRSIGAIILLTLLIHIGYFHVKIISVLDNQVARSPIQAKEQIKKFGIKNNALIASYEYYYICRSLNMEYIGYEIPINLNRRIRYHLDSTRATHILVNEKDQKSHQFEIYLRTHRIKKVTEIRYPEYRSHIPFSLERYIGKSPTYQGSLYEIVK